jgi:hypothetical protein
MTEWVVQVTWRARGGAKRTKLISRRAWKEVKRRWEDNIKIGVRKVWTGFVCLKIRTSGGLFLTRQWTFGIHKWRVISWLVWRLSASQEGLCFTVLVKVTSFARQSLSFYPRPSSGITNSSSGWPHHRELNSSFREAMKPHLFMKNRFSVRPSVHVQEYFQNFTSPFSWWDWWYCFQRRHREVISPEVPGAPSYRRG